MNIPSRSPDLCIAFVLFVVGAVSFASAQSIVTWTSESDTVFATGSNWDNGAPADDLTSHIIRFSNADLANPVLATSQRVAGVNISAPTTLSSTDNANLTVGASNIVVSNAIGEVAIGTALGGGAKLIKTGVGTLTLSGANTYSGGTSLASGTLTSAPTLNLASASALGSGRLTIETGSNATLNNTSGAALTLSTNNDLTLTGSRITFTGTHSLNFGTGTVTLGTGVKTFDVTANTLTIGAVTGAGSLRKFGDGNLVVAGSTSFADLTASHGTVTLAGSSTRTGTNVLNLNGRLNINHASALGTGSFTINGNNTRLDNTSGTAIILTTGNSQIWNSNITFTGTDSLDLGTGAVTRNASKTVTVNGNTLTVGGAISGGDGLTKAGVGTLELAGENLYDGATVVNAGTLRVTGSLTSDSTVTVNAGGTLSGSGIIHGNTTIASGGTLAPGADGVLTFGAYVTLAEGSTTIFEINGSERGVSHDAIDLTAGPLAYGGVFDLVFGTTLVGDTTLDLFSLFDETNGGGFTSIRASGSYSGMFVNEDRVWTLVDGPQTITFSEVTGDLVFFGAPIPEPSACAAFFGVSSLGVAAWRRKRRTMN